MPPATTALIIANVAIFLLQGLAPQLIVPFALWPLATSGMNIGASFAPWQLVTYAFLHGGLLHLAFNMFALYMFGGALERVFGTRRYLTLYFVSVLSAAATQLAVAWFRARSIRRSELPAECSGSCSPTRCTSRTTG